MRGALLLDYFAAFDSLWRFRQFEYPESSVEVCDVDQTVGDVNRPDEQHRDVPVHGSWPGLAAGHFMLL